MKDILNSDYVYLDYAATAPLCREAACAMEPYLISGRENISVGANANSLHTPGRIAFKEIEEARRNIAALLGASRPDEIIFTSGATESDNAALIGLVRAEQSRRNRIGKQDFVPHVITSQIEHDAILKPSQRLEAQGCRLTYLRPDSQGFINPSILDEKIDNDTVLVSIQMANSEIGSVQSIKELADIAHKNGALFHTDAVQALGKMPVNLSDLDVDAASFSAHKVGGPKGVGVLYLRTRTPFEPILLGGGQENSRRSGTQNVCGIVGMKAAFEATIKNLSDEVRRLSALRNECYKHLGSMNLIRPTVKEKSDAKDFLPNIVHVLVDGFESETIILRLDKRGIGVSGGSACSSHSLGQSHVLKAIGITGDIALGALRVSMGRYTTEEDIKKFLSVLPECLEL